jgi:hypothetical protein
MGSYRLVVVKKSIWKHGLQRETGSAASMFSEPEAGAAPLTSS